MKLYSFVNTSQNNSFYVLHNYILLFVHLLLQDFDQAPSREELLQSHLKNWSEVRKRWRLASQKNEERYAASKEILTKMFERYLFFRNYHNRFLILTYEKLFHILYLSVRAQLVVF